VGLQDERDAFDGGGVGAFATLDESLFDQTLRIREQSDSPAGIAFATSVIGLAFAVGGLCEVAGESEFANAVRAGEEQRMRHATGAKSSAQRSDNLRVAAKFGPRHGYRFS
jgi:hypothetical protein